MTLDQLTAFSVSSDGCAACREEEALCREALQAQFDELNEQCDGADQRPDAAIAQSRAKSAEALTAAG
jgi:hypothetical protein